MFQLAVRIWTENGMIYPAKFSVLYDVYKKESHVRAFIKNDKIVSDEYMLITPFSASDGSIFEKDIIVVDDNEAMRVVEFNTESGSYQAINIKDDKDIIVMTSKHTYETAGNVFEDTDIVEGTKYAVKAAPKPDVKKEVEEIKKDEKPEPAVKPEPVKENPDKKNVQRNEQNQGNQNQQNQNNQQQNNNQEQGNPNKRNKKNKKNKQDRQDNRDKSDNRQQPNVQNNQSNQQKQQNQNQQKNNQDKPKDTRPEQKEAPLPKEPPVREEKKPLPANVKEEQKEKVPEVKEEQKEVKAPPEVLEPVKAEPVKSDVPDKQEAAIPVKEEVSVKEEPALIKEPEVNKDEKAEISEVNKDKEEVEVKEPLLKENHDGQMSFITEPDESDYFDEPKKEKEEASALKNKAEKPAKAELYFISECPSRNGSYVFSVLSRGMEETFFGEEDNTDSKKIALQGLIDSLSSFEGSFNITIFTDSQYVVYPFIKGWINKWKNSNWFKNDTDRIQNFELWAQLLELSNKYNVKWEFVAQPTEQMIKCKNILKVNKH